ncbi:MAG: polysaccharide deacetylase family protein [Balneolaceae bacterium]
MKKMRQLCYAWVLLGIIGFISASAYAQQKSISITIDDVPNTTNYQKDNISPVLLHVLDSLNVPFTLFINEGRIQKNGFTDINKELLKKWIAHGQALIGNHTYGHSRYSEVGFDNFVKDIEQGELLTRQYASMYNKEVRYFRFPFNDLGKDSTQHLQIRAYLKSRDYVIAPFTIESSDWMFNDVYQYYLDNEEPEKAKAIGEHYVNKTIELVKFYETLSETIYNRPIKQIYLCHDNAINAVYLADIITRLKKMNYEIVSFEESLTDPIYKQEDSYYKKWGVSWLYRWMNTQKESVDWMKQEPDLSEIEKTYNEILKM